MRVGSHRTLLVGVGGQGVHTAARVLGAAAHLSGANVVVGQLHGMSQRGGSVECTVKVGAEESSTIGVGQADTVLAFEPLEALRALPRMRPDTRLLVNVAPIVPFEIARTGAAYPSIDAIFGELAARGVAGVRIDGRAVVGQTGEGRTLNAVMLGAACALGMLATDEQHVRRALLEATAARFREANERAFTLGREATHPVRGRGFEVGA